jgi:hypothetical protein
MAKLDLFEIKASLNHFFLIVDIRSSGDCSVLQKTNDFLFLINHFFAACSSKKID